MNENSKYARILWQRKFLLDGLPDLISKLTPKQLIQDHYLINTNLLVRQVTSQSGTTYVLRKKYTLEPEKDATFQLTNIYLEEKEYHNFLSLPAYQFHKTRYLLDSKKQTLYLDRMVLNFKEILLAKAFFKTEAAFKIFQLPFSCVQEVTSEKAFQGYEIAKQHWTSMNY